MGMLLKAPTFIDSKLLLKCAQKLLCFGDVMV